MLLLTTGSYLQVAQDLTSVSVWLGLGGLFIGLVESLVLFIEFKLFNFL
jgi:hypothetical protein